MYKGKSRITNKWVHGDLLTKHRFHQGLVIVENGLYGLTDHPIVGQTLCRRTMLTDINGKKAYTNDIVKVTQFLFDGTEYEKEITGVITDGEFGLLLTAIDCEEVCEHMGYENGEGFDYLIHFYGLEDQSFEVIGNVFDTIRGDALGVKEEE